MRVRIQSESGPGSRFTITNVTIPQAWHRDDHQVDYYIRGSQPSSIQAITVGLFSSRKPGHLADHEISPALLSLTNYADAAQAWNDVKAGVTVNQVSSAGRADVVIRGYWDANPADGIDPECGRSIACTDPAGRYPHIGNQQTFWIEDPPHWGREASTREWTVDFKEWFDDPDVYQYLPSIIMHEFGHTIGLGHGTTWKDIMNGRTRELEPCSYTGTERERCGLTTNDKKAAEAIYEHHTAH